MVTDFGIFLAVYQVIYLVWILFQVIKFIRIQKMDRQLVTFGDNTSHDLQAAEAVMVHLISGKLHKYIVINLLGRIVDLRQHALTFQKLRNRQSEILHHGRCNIDLGSRRFLYAALCSSLDDQRNVGYFLVHCRILGGQSVGSPHSTVVGGIDDHGVRRYLLNLVKHSSHLIVCKGVTA